MGRRRASSSYRPVAPMSVLLLSSRATDLLGQVETGMTKVKTHIGSIGFASLSLGAGFKPERDLLFRFLQQPVVTLCLRARDRSTTQAALASSICVRQHVCLQRGIPAALDFTQFPLA